MYSKQLLKIYYLLKEGNQFGYPVHTESGYKIHSALGYYVDKDYGPTIVWQPTPESERWGDNASLRLLQTLLRLQFGETPTTFLAKYTMFGR